MLVSHQFGFGAIDAEAMVTRAQHWTTVPQQNSCTLTPSSNGNKSVLALIQHVANVLCACSYATGGAPLKIQFNVGSDCRLVFLEHVVVQMSLSITVKYGGYYSYDDYYNDPYVVYHDGPRRGNIFLEMYSPHGTRFVSNFAHV